VHGASVLVRPGRAEDRVLAREAKDSRSGRMGGTMEGRVTLVRELSAKIVAEVWQTRILAM